LTSSFILSSLTPDHGALRLQTSKAHFPDAIQPLSRDPIGMTRTLSSIAMVRMVTVIPHSIFNRHGTYGGRYSALSPFYRFTTTPPKVFRKGKSAGYLTANTSLHPRIEPDLITDWAVNHVSK
jgi:hypothetical protein